MKRGKLYGYNTDGVGYMMSVQEAGFQIIGKKMTLIGGRRCSHGYFSAGGIGWSKRSFPVLPAWKVMEFMHRK